MQLLKYDPASQLMDQPDDCVRILAGSFVVCCRISIDPNSTLQEFCSQELLLDASHASVQPISGGQKHKSNCVTFATVNYFRTLNKRSAGKHDIDAFRYVRWPGQRLQDTFSNVLPLHGSADTASSYD